jgi:DNA damage-inducible protein 1
MKVIAICTFNQKRIEIEIEPEFNIEQIKAIILSCLENVNYDISLMFKDKMLGDTSTAFELGIKEGSELYVLAKKKAPINANTSSTQQSNIRPSLPTTQSQVGQPDLLLSLKVMALRGELMKDIERLKVLNPKLAEAVINNDQKVLIELTKKRDVEYAESQKILMDPDNPENQKKIEKMIKKNNVHENYLNAFENNPEVFISVPMLYVECSINGVSLQAFVDSGAQNTIMSRSFAKKCNLLHLVDESFKGIARGVGMGVILGKIHSADIHIGGKVIPTSFTVMDDKCGVNFLFGLDNLRKHRCSIDLAHNKLFLLSGEISVPFIDESKIMKESFHVNEEEEQALMLSALKREESKEELPFPEESIAVLMSHGFTRENCIKALLFSGGNVKMALSHLNGNI